MASLWNKIVGFFSPKSKTPDNYSMVSFNPFTSNSNVQKECNATYMSCIGCYANAISKIEPKLWYKDAECKDPMNYVFGTKPNPGQNSINFWKQVIVSFFENNVAAIWVEWDFSGPKRMIKNLWSIDVADAHFEMKEYQGGIYFSFVLDGKTKFVPIDEMIILVNMPSTSNPYITHSEALTDIVNVVSKDFQGLQKSLEMANILRFIATANGALPTKTLEERQTKLADLMRKVGSDGIFYVDNAQSLTQVQNTSKWVAPDEIKEFKNQIYVYFHLTESIVNGSASDEVIASWMELSVEPIINEVCKEATSKVLTARERDFGNEIKVNTNILFTASLTHRISLATTLISSGIYYPNEIRGIVGVSPLDEKDNEIVKRIDRVDEQSDKSKGGNAK